MTGRLSNEALKVLAAVIQIYRCGSPPTYPRIQKVAGVKSRGSVNLQLNTLRAKGLVSFEFGKCGTIRPTCSVILFLDAAKLSGYTQTK